MNDFEALMARLSNSVDSLAEAWKYHVDSLVQMQSKHSKNDTPLLNKSKTVIY